MSFLKKRLIMKLDKSALTLYAITNFNFYDSEISITDKLEKAIKGGVTCIQLREKSLPHEQFLIRALLIRKICKKSNIPFIVNDNLKIAIESNANGIHIGQDDLNISEARKLIGNKILGVSVQTPDQAIEAEKYGADYLGVGAIFSTQTKKEASIVSIDTLKKISHDVSIPVVAIGGLNFKNIEKLNNSGISGTAMSSAIFSSNDIETQTRNLFNLSKKLIEV